MINVKGTKSKASPQDQADAYRLKADPASSSIPLAIGGFMAALVLYIKSMFGGAEASPAMEDGPKGTGQEEQPNAPKSEVLGAPQEKQPAPKAAAQPDEDGESASSSTSASAPSSGSNLVPLFSATPASPAKGIVQPSFVSDDPFDQWQRQNQEEGTEIVSYDPFDQWQQLQGEEAAQGAVSMQAARRAVTGDGTDGDPDADRNSAPTNIRSVILRDIVSGGALFILAADLLRQSLDDDGDELFVENVKSTGGSIEQVDGGFLFHPAPGTVGPVEITYEVTDGKKSVDQTAKLDVSHELLKGTDDDDGLVGNRNANEIDGLDGDDEIVGNGGQDILRGGAGDDHIVGGKDNDVIYGGDGDDEVYGMGGKDQIEGGAGDDALYGGDGDDFVSGGSGRDYVSGDAGDDRLLGGDDDDELDGGAGSDFVLGGAGDDKMVGNADAKADIYDGGEGKDTVDYSATTKGVSINLKTGIAEGEETGTDTLISVENAVGGKGADQIEGSSSDNVIDAGDGEDVVSAGAGKDRVVGTLDAKRDVYSGGEGDDTLDYSSAQKDLKFDMRKKVVSGEETGDDEVDDFEIIVAGDGDDLFLVERGSDGVSFSGRGGKDVYDFRDRDDDEDWRDRDDWDGRDYGSGYKYKTSIEISDFTPGDKIMTSKYEIYNFDRCGDDDRNDKDESGLEYAFNIQTNAKEKFAGFVSRYEFRGEDEYTYVRVDEDEFDEFFEAYLYGHIKIAINVHD